MMQPPFTPEMQALWNRAMHLHRTSSSYGVSLPQPGTSYPPPTSSSLLALVLFTATASPEAYYTFEEAAREDITGWKMRIKNLSGNARPLPSFLTNQVEILI